MTPTSTPITRDLVLIGGGHAHALVLRMWGMNPLPGVRVTLINPEPTAPYTGMLPGLVAGHYEPDDLAIDLVRLARFAGARLILDRATGFDRKRRTVQLAARPPISFDVASLNIGITSGALSLPGAQEHAVAAKPLGPFADRWLAFRTAVRLGARKPSVCVIGGGVGGAELAMAMAHRLRGDTSQPPTITLIEAAPTLLPRESSMVRAAITSGLAQNGVTIRTGSPAVSVTDSTVTLADGTLLEAAFTTTVAGARPAPWLPDTGLALDTSGFVRVSETLQTITDPAIFAAGDIAAMDHAPREKAGVFAVRQAPVLFNNLRAVLSGEALRPFRPQRTYLKLVSLGDRRAVACKAGLAVRAPGLWAWKDRIDRAFMDRLTNLPAMALAEPPPGPVALGVRALHAAEPPCAGCGAKVGPGALAAGLAALNTINRPDILLAGGDDGAVLRWGEGDEAQILATDHLRAFTADPYVFARITAQHALNDIWAMGGDPQAALATIILPPLDEAHQATTLAEIMAGFESVLTPSGAALVGGHTSLGAELTLGLSLTGRATRSTLRTQIGARPGDALILTRPIGLGTVLAGEMRGLARGTWVASALDQMQQGHAEAARLLRTHARAMTDITGFGLAGHLATMMARSGTAARLSLAAIPLASGARELAIQGVRSSLWAANRAAVTLTLDGVDEADPAVALLFDPQTSGGLLASVPAEQAEALIEALHAAGTTPFRIGEVLPPPSGLTISP